MMIMWRLFWLNGIWQTAGNNVKHYPGKEGFRLQKQRFRKTLWIWIGCLLFAGICMAQTLEVPFLDQWVYRELSILYNEGFLDNYPNEWVQSGNHLSRFEIAYYIKQTITLKLKDEQQSLIEPSVEIALQRLISEFRNELEALGIKITDISKISPNLVVTDIEAGEYQDLDLLFKDKRGENNIPVEPFYYFGEYLQSWQRKSFVFLPASFVNPQDLLLLEGSVSNLNLLHSTQFGEEQSFLVVRGELPVSDESRIKGYYLFPVEENLKDSLVQAEDAVISLLDEVNQIQQIEHLWRYEGMLPLSGYTRKETTLQSKTLFGDIQHGLKVGGLLLLSQAPATTNFETTDFGLPFYTLPQAQPSGAVDLDRITNSSLESLQINIHGSKAISPHTSVYGGLDLIYRESENNALFESLLPSDTKASAGISHQVNGYWTLLTYQSFVNSRANSGVISTTSIGLKYDDWVTFWLAYQLLDFDDPVVTGALTFRF